MVRLLAAVLTAALVLALGGCSRDDAEQAPNTLNVYMWSEYIDPELLAQFEKETGIKVNLDVYESTEAMMAKLKQVGGQYDVVVVSDHAVPVLAELGDIQPLDLSKIPNAANVMAKVRKPYYDPQDKYSIPYQWGTMGLFYRTDKLPELEPSWAVVLDPAAQPGPVVLIDSMRDQMAAALLMLGKDGNTTYPADLQAAGELIL